MAIQKMEMGIDGMHCEECADSIRSVAECIDGMRAVLVDYGRKAFAGEYDDEAVDRDAIVKEIESIGYRMVEI